MIDSNKETALSQEELKYYLHYSKKTGLFTWIRPTVNSNKKGDIIGDKCNSRYIIVTLHRKRYVAHRLAWFYVYGEWPEPEIDHNNGNGKDNRICNLRLATRAQNTYNTRTRCDNTTGYRGVSKGSGRNAHKWVAQITYKGKVKYLGSFNSAEEAHIAYTAWARAIHNTFLFGGHDEHPKLR
jgi:hypothetical protein